MGEADWEEVEDGAFEGEEVCWRVMADGLRGIDGSPRKEEGLG